MLRNYQEFTVNKMLWSITVPGNGLVSVPTGGGKTHIIAEFTKRLGKPVLILVPSKELLEQDLAKLQAVVDPSEIGVFSASMNSKEIKTFTLATIQSAYKKPELFNHYDVVIIDEADLVNPKSLEGMYRGFFTAIGNPRIIGLTATPFRMDSYYRRWGRASWQVETVHTVKFLTRYQERFWNRIIHVVHAQDLINEGFLVPLTYHRYALISQDRLAFNKSKSEFDLEDFEGKFNPFLQRIADMIEEREMKSALIFCATITQANNLKALIPGSEVVTGETSKKERERIVGGFRAGTIKVALNVGVLLTGFDKPDLEHIIIARPTRSLRLHSQLLGRGMRIFPGKETCHVWDLVGNIGVLGTAESMRIEKLEGKWNIVSDTQPDGWHYKELYSFKLKLKKTEDEEEL